MVLNFFIVVIQFKIDIYPNQAAKIVFFLNRDIIIAASVPRRFVKVCDSSFYAIFALRWKKGRAVIRKQVFYSS